MIGTKTYPFPATFREALAAPDHTFKSLFGCQSVKGWLGLKDMEAFLRTHPDVDTLVDLGCGAGMHTLYFAVWAELNYKRVYAYDASTEACRIYPILRHMPRTTLYTRTDVWATGAPMPWLNESGCVVLYSDIGPREACGFARRLKRGDYLIVHAWGHMTTAQDVQPLIDDGTLAYYERDVWEQSNGHQMGFIRL